MLTKKKASFRNICLYLKFSVVHSRRALGYHWDQWTRWTSCNATCDGTQYRVRACLHTRTISNRTLTSSTDISHCSSQLSGHYYYDRKSCGSQCPGKRNAPPNKHKGFLKPVHVTKNLLNHFKSEKTDRTLSR